MAVKENTSTLSIVVLRPSVSNHTAVSQEAAWLLLLRERTDLALQPIDEAVTLQYLQPLVTASHSFTKKRGFPLLTVQHNLKTRLVCLRSKIEAKN